MTKEERNDAIEFFKRVKEKEAGGARYSSLAIEALQNGPCENVSDTNDGNIYECSCGYGWDKSKVVRHHFCPNCGRAVDNSIKTELEPCDDCISRQAVLDALDKSKYSNEFCEEHHIDWSINLGMAHIVVNELKSVTPQPEMGRWIRKTVAGYFVWGCNQCGWQQRFATNFCPDCGTRMDESPESEEE